MRFISAALVLLLLPVAADAGQRHRGRRESSPPPAPASAPQPYVASPLLPAGWSGLRDPEDEARRAARKRSPRFAHPYDGRSVPFGGYYAVPYGGAGYYPAEPESTTTIAPHAEPVGVVTTGTLRLEITPAVTMQYYVDGYLIGTSAELGHDLELNAGARRVEIRAEGYKPLTFDTRIRVGGEATYRGTLERLTDDQSNAPKPTGPKTMYVIPGCYMGNVPPDRDALPKGCDARRMTTR